MASRNNSIHSNPKPWRDDQSNYFQASGLGFLVKSLFGTTVILYILNQKHLLPRHLSAIVSKVLFWPTLPITVSRRLGKWITPIDDTVVMGGAPFGFAGIPEELYSRYNVRGVINLCEEYQGPLQHYRRLHMEELYLPTTDHFEPKVSDFVKAIAFIEKFKAKGERVYVHCRAGHGRSAAVVFAWLLKQNPKAVTEELNKELYGLRDVRRTLWKQPNIRAFHEQLLKRKKKQ